MSYVSILIRGTIFTQKDSGEGSDSVVGTGHNLTSQGGAGFWGAGDWKVTARDDAHLQGGSHADPTEASLGQKRKHAGAGPSLSASLEGSCSQALVCQEGKQGNQHSPGTFWAPGPMPAYDIIIAINIVLLNRMLGHRVFPKPWIAAHSWIMKTA